MDPVAHTPTEPADYAAITALYGSLLALLVLASRARGTAEPVQPFEMATLAGATFALSKTIGQEKVETWLRRPFVEELPDGEKRPRGSGTRYAIGELLSCTRCLGAWSALGLERPRPGGPAHRLAARRTHRLHRPGRLGGQRLPAGGLPPDLPPGQPAGGLSRR